MKVILDRWEGEFGIVELPDGNFAELPKMLIPDAKEGDVIAIAVEEGETRQRQERIQSLMQQVFHRE